MKLEKAAKCSLCVCFGDATGSCCISVKSGGGQLANLTPAVHVGVCVCREVQKALSRARSLFDRWEELLQDGTQVSSVRPRITGPESRKRDRFIRFLSRYITASILRRIPLKFSR